MQKKTIAEQATGNQNSPNSISKYKYCKLVYLERLNDWPEYTKENQYICLNMLTIMANKCCFENCQKCFYFHRQP